MKKRWVSKYWVKTGGEEKTDLLLVCKDIDADQVHFGMTVFSGLRSGHLHNLAGPAFQHNETVFAKSRALHRIRLGSTGVSGLEMMIVHLSHLKFLVTWN